MVTITCSRCGKKLWEGLTNPENKTDWQWESKVKNMTLWECMNAVCSDCLLEDIKKED